VAVRLPRRSRANTLLPTAALPLSAVLAIALPILFLHVDYQPGFTVSVGSAEAHVVLSDLAVLAVAVAAATAGLRYGFEPLRAGWPVWLCGGLFLALVGASSVYPRLWTDHYASSTHVVSAVKFAEYGLLALAVPLLVRARRDLELVLASLVAWSAVATIVAVAQVFGADILQAWAAGRRQPSFLGHHDFAALSGATLALALIGLALGGLWRPGTLLLATAGLAGGVGLVLSGSSAAAIGLAVAAGVVALTCMQRGWLAARQAVAGAAIVAVAVGGVVVLRAGDFNQFLRFAGVGQASAGNTGGVQTYVQHTLLVYIGWRIFLDHPVAGAGWQASSAEPSVYERHRAAAEREFPDAPPLAFPTPAHPWGVQNAYVQALADIGVIGLVLLLATLASGLLVGGVAALRAPPATAIAGLIAVAWLFVVAGVWTAVGLVAGLPLDALTWLALGLAAAAAGGARLARV
jgi:O-antigen ligase